VLTQQQSTSLATSTVTTVSAALTTTTTTTTSAMTAVSQRSSPTPAQTEISAPAQAKQRSSAQVDLLNPTTRTLTQTGIDSELIGDNTFHVTSVTKGNIKETKLQILTEENYRLVTKHLNEDKKNFYKYQLKSSRGLQVVIKGIESSVPIADIALALEKAGFSVKNVVNIINRAKIAQPMFKVELKPETKPMNNNAVHPIYNLRYLLHRRITVEEPHKRNGPVQCTNCQEFGHTRTYCTLRPVCVACGDLHASASCKAIKDDVAVKKCSNCGGNHTANYRGCPVYKDLKSRMNQRNTAVRSSTTPTSSYTYQHLTPSTTTPGAFFANAQRVPNVYFADALKLQTQPSTAESNSNQETFANIQRNNTEQMQPNPPTCGVEGMILNLTHCMTQFMSTMQNMIQDLIKAQHQLLQILTQNIEIEPRLTSNNTNWLKYKKYISSHLKLNAALNCERDIDSLVEHFKETFTTAAGLATPNQVQVPPTHTSVTNTEIEKLVAEKRRLRRQWQSHRSPTSQLLYKAASRKLKQALKRAEDRNLQ
ncbi:PREDICTED: nucleic-acid-binding protein from mobile element jockey-like, partial [Rhagoletis zephyria]|uniref:nucleic-acid-binding protein from mobile element jockey-like n=1 Tax=Rhagoletis zephyria TaxID=28612 RepID=UPI0008114A02